MDYKVIMTTPTWNLSGVNTSSANLIRGLRSHGIEATMLLTRTDDFPHYHVDLPYSPDIPFEILPVEVKKSYWEDHWTAIIEYLEKAAPCIYVPNYDFEHSCVIPELSRHVKIVGIVHSDDPEHYEHVRRLGRYWDAIVAVSKHIADKVTLIDSSLFGRILTIPYGVMISSSTPERPKDSDAPLRLIYTGRVLQYQKRILDIPKIIDRLRTNFVPFALTIIGSGPEEKELFRELRDLIWQNTAHMLGTVEHGNIRDMLLHHDVFLLTSEFEGMPLSLLEAMGQGCVPVVTDIPSAIPELIEDGVSGYRVPVGDVRRFADRLEKLFRNTTLRHAMSLNAYNKMKKGGYSIEAMTRRYIDLFDALMSQKTTNFYKRPEGKILPPPSLLKFAPYL